MHPGANAWQDPEGRCQEDMGRSLENGLERFSVPRREQASMASLKFYYTLAEPYALLMWAVPGACTSASDSSRELGSFCLENET